MKTKRICEMGKKFTGRQLGEFQENTKNIAGLERYDLNTQRKNFKLPVEDFHHHNLPEREDFYIQKTKGGRRLNNSYGKQIRSIKRGAKERLNTLIDEKYQRKLMKAPLSKSQKYYLNRIIRLKNQLKKILEDATLIYSHSAYRQLYAVCLEQIGTRKWDFKEVWQYLSENYSDLQGE